MIREFCLVGLKKVKRLGCRQNDQVIIERTIAFVLGPSTTLHKPFLKHCFLTEEVAGTLLRALSKPP